MCGREGESVREGGREGGREFFGGDCECLRGRGTDSGEDEARVWCVSDGFRPFHTLMSHILLYHHMT